MPEQQEPFVHQDGKTVVLRPKPAELTSDVLARLIRTMTEIRERADSSIYLASANREPYDQVVGILTMLREPGFNSAAIGYAALPPADAALIGDLAALLLSAGTARHRIVLEMRAALERFS